MGSTVDNESAVPVSPATDVIGESSELAYAEAERWLALQLAAEGGGSRR
jgi:hypothetical protein